ncbi:MAG: hypothetical protein ACK4K0_01745 [Flavobacteriales bacterium]
MRFIFVTIGLLFLTMLCFIADANVLTVKTLETTTTLKWSDYYKIGLVVVLAVIGVFSYLRFRTSEDNS